MPATRQADLFRAEGWELKFKKRDYRAIRGRGRRDSQDSRRASSEGEDDLIGRAFHQHKLHLSEVHGLRRDQSGRIFLKNDRLVFHEGE